MKRLLLFLLIPALTAAVLFSAGCAPENGPSGSAPEESYVEAAGSAEGEEQLDGQYDNLVVYNGRTTYLKDKCEVNGVKRTGFFAVSAPDRETLRNAENFASGAGGTLLSCPVLSSPGGKFAGARVTFIVDGVSAGDDIRAYQPAGGNWTGLKVSNVGDRHFTVEIDACGPVALVRVS